MKTAQDLEMKTSAFLSLTLLLATCDFSQLASLDALHLVICRWEKKEAEENLSKEMYVKPFIQGLAHYTGVFVPC